MFVPFIKMLVYSDFGFFFGRVAVVDDRSCHPTEDGFYHVEELSPGVSDGAARSQRGGVVAIRQRVRIEGEK